MSNLETHLQEQAELTALCEAGLCDHAECKPDRLASLDALAVAFMATRPDLRQMSLDEFLIEYCDRLSPDERAAGAAILALHNAETWES